MARAARLRSRPRPLAGPRRRRTGRRAIADRAAVLHTMENLPEICGDLRLNGFPQCKARRGGLTAKESGLD